MENPITPRELDQFRALMEAENEQLKQENDRQNHRINILEQNAREISNLVASTEKLAANMENMLKIKEQQDKRLEQNAKEISNLAASTEKLAANMENMLKIQEKQDKRLEQIEGRDGEKWRKMLSYIGTAIVSAVLTIVFAKIGL